MAEEDRRVRRTKRQLREALTALMREKNVREITVKELTDLADVNRGTFYCHYKDVFDMAEQVEGALFDEFSALLNAYDAERLRVGLRPILRDIFSFIQRNVDLCAAILGGQEDSRFLERLKALVQEKILREWSGLYQFQNGPQREHYIAFLVGGAISLIQSWAVSGRGESAEEMAALAEELILHGIERAQMAPWPNAARETKDLVKWQREKRL